MWTWRGRTLRFWGGGHNQGWQFYIWKLSYKKTIMIFFFFLIGFFYYFTILLKEKDFVILPFYQKKKILYFEKYYNIRYCYNVKGIFKSVWLVLDSRNINFRLITLLHNKWQLSDQAHKKILVSLWKKNQLLVNKWDNWRVQPTPSRKERYI